MKPNLKILIDISHLTARPLIGIGKITENLLKAMETRGDVEVIKFALVARGLLPQLKEKYPDVIAPSIPARLSKFTTNFIQTLSIPVDSFIQPADAILNTGWSCFTIRAGISVALVADLTPLTNPEWYPRDIIDLFLRRVKSIKKNADILIAISEYTKRQVGILTDIASSKVVVAYPGVSEHFISTKKVTQESRLKRLKSKYGLPHKYLLFVGIQNPRKNLTNLFSAYSKLPDKYQNQYKLVIVGSKDYIHKLTLPKHSRYLGFVLDKDLPAIYATAVGFVYTSFVEGFGLPILEAFAMRIPVLTSNTSGMAEVAQGAAILVDPYSIKDITRGLEEMITLNKAKREKLIQAGKKRLQEFSFDNMADRIIQEIHKRR